MTQEKKNGNIVAIITMFFIFAMISFVTNLAAPIGTIWGHQFEGNSVLGMMGNMMNFLAYLFMGIPAGNLLVKIGYKKTALWAMAVGVIGLAVQGRHCRAGGISRKPQLLYLFARCIHLRVLRVYVEYGRESYAQYFGRWREQGQPADTSRWRAQFALGDSHPVFRRCAYRFAHQVNDDDRCYSFAVDRYGRLCCGIRYHIVCCHTRAPHA